MKRPPLWLALAWSLLAAIPLPAYFSQAAPRWVGLTFLLQVVLFLGIGYLNSATVGYGTALVTTMVIAAVQLLARGAWLGNPGFWWATLVLDLTSSLSGALLWRWREAHYGADFHFDLIAPWYERLIHPQDPARLLEALQLTPTSRVLDAGGGTGRVAQFFQPARQLVVADLSVGMLRYASQKPKVQAVATLTERLPFPDNTFDRVVMVDALHHVFEQHRSVKELWRVLTPGGRLVIEEPDFNLLIIKALALGEKLLLMRSHFLRPEEIAALLPPNAKVSIDTKSGMAHIIATK